MKFTQNFTIELDPADRPCVTPHRGFPQVSLHDSPDPDQPGWAIRFTPEQLPYVLKVVEYLLQCIPAYQIDAYIDALYSLYNQTRTFKELLDEPKEERPPF